MPETNQNNNLPQLVRDQRLITSCALDVIKAVNNRRGKPLQPRDRMALKLLTPKNSALLVKNGVRNLGCRQVSFDILTDDFRIGQHRLTPTGVHVLNPEKGWWSDRYGTGQFLWNLYLKEDVKDGMSRILQRLFKFKMQGVFGPKAAIHVKDHTRTISGNIDSGLKLFIKREEGTAETTLRRMMKAGAVHSPRDLGLNIGAGDKGYLVLLFGKDNRFGVSFMIEKL